MNSIKVLIALVVVGLASIFSYSYGKNVGMVTISNLLAPALFQCIDYIEPKTKGFGMDNGTKI